MATETDDMVCRACGNKERASEGYPCEDCGTYLCLMCSMKGVSRCRSCAEKAGVPLIPEDASGRGGSN